MKNLDINELAKDLENSTLIQNPADDLDELVANYNSVLRELFDKHAPMSEREVVLRPHSKWFNKQIQKAKQERRQAERKFQKSKSTTHVEKTMK